MNSPAPRGPARRRTLLVFISALVLVVAIALVVGFLRGDPAPSDLDAGGTAGGDMGVTETHRPLERVEPGSEDWEALLPRLKKVVDADPHDRNAQRKLALAYYNLGRLKEAEALYEDLLADEEDPVLRNRLGNTLRDLGDAAGAEKAYRRAITEDPTLPPPYINLAELLWREGRDQDALQALEEGSRAVPEDKAAALQEAHELLNKFLAEQD